MSNKELKTEAYKALCCLYLAVEESIADYVNIKVKSYIEALENAVIKEEI